MKITINNWNKYQPRRDLKSMNWFRVDNRIMTDPNFYGLGPDQKYLWIALLSFAALANKDTVELEIGYITHVTGMEKNRATEAIKFFHEKGLLTVTDTEAAHTRDEDVHYEQNEQDGRTDGTKNATAAAGPKGPDSSVVDGPLAKAAADADKAFVRKEVKPSTQEAWLRAYPDGEWLLAEIHKARAWLEVNPKRRPKNFARFMGNWLSRAWEQHRKTIGSVQPGARKGIAALLADREQKNGAR